MQRQTVLAVALVGLMVGAGVGASAVALFGPGSASPTAGPAVTDGPDHPTIERFDSAAAFQAYLSRAAARGGLAGGAAAGGDGAAREQSVRTDSSRETVAEQATRAPRETAAGEDASGVDRVSETNVQETGIDEPDLLKTDGESAFYAVRRGHDRGHTAVVNTSDPAHPELAARVPDSGQLLLVGDDLVVIGDREVTGYDVSDRENPTETWSRSLDSGVLTARLIDGDVYLLTRQRVAPGEGCTVRSFAAGDGIDCTDIHHPTVGQPGDVVYTALVLSPGDGTVTERAAVVGTADHAATYVSANAIYLTYDASPDRTAALVDVLRESEVLDRQARNRLDRLASYELSPAARRAELRDVLRDWRARLPAEEREAAMERLQERVETFFTEHRRDLHRSGVVEIELDDGDLSVGASGTVPGEPLNQFSMDEHDGHLRIATTVRGMGGADSTNDLYVLDRSLSVVGSVQDMGVTERIYSVRFKDDEAYVVTFRQVDPFYVIDLSDQRDPTLEGELKLPGFSRYLHPVAEDRVLGIGEEDGRVKLTLFDTSDPENPEIVESTVLDARFSAVARSHHAFLQDRKHGVFFLPTEDGGHVFSYEGGLEEVTRIETDGPARRAMYLNDYLYVFGTDELVVVNETDWTRGETVDL